MFGINALTGNEPVYFRSCLEVAIRVFDVGTNVVAPKNAKAEQQFFFSVGQFSLEREKSSSGIYVFFVGDKKMLKQSTSSSASSGSLTSRAPVSRKEGAKGIKERRRRI